MFCLGVVALAQTLPMCVSSKPRGIVPSQSSWFALSARFAIYVIANGEITTFDRPTMIKHTKRIVDELYSLPLSEQQMKDGMRLAREFEEKRVARMNSQIEVE